MHSHEPQRPLPAHCWAALENEASRVLNALLTARQLCDVVRTDDWSRSALPLGKAEALDRLGDGNAKVYVRQARPLIELRVPFSLDREVIRELNRKGPVADLSPVAEAARAFARLEDEILFEGVEGINAPGLLKDAESRRIAVPTLEDLPGAVAKGVQRLHEGGVGGPYSFVASTDIRTALASEIDDGGVVLLDRVRRNVEFVGEASPSLHGAIVCSRRGGDFRLHLGRGAHLVFEWQDASELHFSLVQSMALEFGGRDALVVLESPSLLARVPATREPVPLSIRELEATPPPQEKPRPRIEANLETVSQTALGGVQ